MVLKFGIPSHLKLKSNRSVNAKLNLKKSPRNLSLNVGYLVDGPEIQQVDYICKIFFNFYFLTCRNCNVWLAARLQYLKYRSLRSLPVEIVLCCHFWCYDLLYEANKLILSVLFPFGSKQPTRCGGLAWRKTCKQDSKRVLHTVHRAWFSYASTNQNQPAFLPVFLWCRTVKPSTRWVGRSNQSAAINRGRPSGDVVLTLRVGWIWLVFFPWITSWKLGFFEGTCLLRCALFCRKAVAS